MASATKRGPGRWLGRYRDPSGKERTKTFPTKGEATSWAREQERRMAKSEWTDPTRARVTVGEWEPTWRGTLNVKPKTIATYESLLKTCVLPRWGSVRLDHIATADVRAWVADMRGPSGKRLSASRVRQSYRLLSAMLDLAVEDGRLPRNPAHGASGTTKGMLPRLPTSNTHNYLTMTQLLRLADETGERRPLVLVLGLCGLRWGEATALRVQDVDLLRNRLLVRQAFSDVKGTLILGLTKSHASRAVSMPAYVREALQPLLAERGPDDLLFQSPQGAAIRAENFRRREFVPAVQAIGLNKLRIHDLRHTAASLAVSAGASVKGVQRMLGHRDASLTLNTYTDLFEDDLDNVAGRLDEALSAARADYVRTAAQSADRVKDGQTALQVV